MTGAAYIYSGTNYATEKKLTASDGVSGSSFGCSVAISGDGTKVIVGAGGQPIGANARQGAAYVYSGTNYAAVQQLTASDGVAQDAIGLSVAMSGDGTRMILGANTKTVGANTRQGAAYIFGAPTIPSPLPSPKPTGPPQAGTPAPLPPIPAPMGPSQAGVPAPLPHPRP